MQEELEEQELHIVIYIISYEASTFLMKMNILFLSNWQ